MLQVGANLAGTRLDLALPQLIDKTGLVLSRGRARALIDAGGVYVDARRVRIASRPVSSNALIVLDLDAQPLAPASPDPAAPAGDLATSPAEAPIDILFEDADVIVVNKPCGWHTQPAIGRAETSVLLELMRQLHRREGSPAQLPTLTLHHRLDRDTSGVLILGRAARANRGLAAAFTDRLATKTYHAVAVGVPTQDRWSVSDPIGRIDDRRFGNVPPPQGRAAHTDLRVLQQSQGRCLLEAVPRTGRTHQIRIHLAASGLPVLGDRLYGDRAFVDAPRLFLHAVTLELPHPVTGRPLRVRARRPAEFDRALDASAPQQPSAPGTSLEP